MSESLHGVTARLVTGAAESISCADDSTRMGLEARFLTFSEDVGWVLGHFGGEGEGGCDSQESTEGECKVLHCEVRL